MAEPEIDSELGPQWYELTMRLAVRRAGCVVDSETDIEMALLL